MENLLNLFNTPQTDDSEPFINKLMEMYQRRHGGFRPESSNYDKASAIAAGLSADETGHWPSRIASTGLLLKGRGHPTWHKTVEEEERLGFEIYKGAGGRYYSRPKQYWQ